VALRSNSDGVFQGVARYTAMIVPLYVIVDPHGIIRYAESHLPAPEFMRQLGGEGIDSK